MTGRHEGVMRISYAGDHFLTGDEAAEALLEYASILAKHNTSDEVQLRTIQSTGDPGISRFLIGPASQVVVSTHTSSIAEPDNADTVAEIRRKVEHLGPWDGEGGEGG